MLCIIKMMETASKTQAASRMLTLAEAAIELGVSGWTVRRLVANGELPTVKFGGAQHRSASRRKRSRSGSSAIRQGESRSD
jgi:excisionase family DNA binding protein